MAWLPTVRKNAWRCGISGWGERGSMLLAQLDVLEQELKQVVGADEDELGNRMIMMMMLFNGRRHGS